MTIDIRKHILPESVEIDGKYYRIKTDFTYWINFIEDTKNAGGEIAPGTVADMFIGEVPADLQKAFESLSQFCYPQEELPNVDDADEHDHRRTFDYVTDSSMIYAAFMQCYGIDLVDTPMHWHKFLALFNNLVGTRLNEVMSYRGYDKNDTEKYEDRLERMREMWELEEIITPEEQENIDTFNAQFD